MDAHLLRLAERVDALSIESYENRERIAVHEAVCTARYEQIVAGQARLDTRLTWTLYLLVISTAIQMAHGSVQDWLFALAKSMIH
jgi:hypothetical protein